jgi:hypothetical protein
MSQSVAALPDRFIQGSASCELIARSKFWSLIRRDYDGAITYVVTPVVERDGRETVVDMEREEIRGFDFHALDDAVGLFSKVLLHRAVT